MAIGYAGSLNSAIFKYAEWGFFITFIFFPPGRISINRIFTINKRIFRDSSYVAYFFFTLSIYCCGGFGVEEPKSVDVIKDEIRFFCERIDQNSAKI
jgi:hypothetical protein